MARQGNDARATIEYTLDCTINPDATSCRDPNFLENDTLVHKNTLTCTGLEGDLEA